MAQASDRSESTSGEEPAGAEGSAGTGTGSHDVPPDGRGADGPPPATSRPGEDETRPGSPPLPFGGVPVHPGVPGSAMQGYEQVPGTRRVPLTPPGAAGRQQWQAPPGHGRHPGPGPGDAGPSSSWPGPGHLPPAGPAWQAPRPGVIPLRPLAHDEVLAGAFRFLASHPLLAFGVTAVCAVLGVGGALLTMPVRAALPDADTMTSAGSVVSIGLAAVELTSIWIVLVITTAVASGMLVVALLGAVVGRRTGIVAAWRTIVPRLAGLIGLHLVIALVFLVIILAAMGSTVVTAYVAPNATYVPLPLLFALAALVALAVHLAVLWARAPAAYVLEPIGVTAALARSRDLARGAWWQTFGVLALTGLLVAVLAAVLVPVGAAVGLRSITTFAVAMIAQPLVTAVGGLLYLDQRIRRERFDLALLAQAG